MKTAEIKISVRVINRIREAAGFGGGGSARVVTGSGFAWSFDG